MPAYTALYRQWRPRRFADMVGQEHVTRTLRHAVRTGTTAHAYLFCGPRGTGKTSAARILAAALNCEQPDDGDPCGACSTCQLIAAERLLDVQEIDAASNRQVEDVRALRETVAYAPASGRHKVYILDEVHMLTEASWNTLLKTLEEPPASTTFVLCTTDPQHVLGTVVSRCQRFDFRRLSVAEIENQLARVCETEHIPAEAAALRAVARRAEGGLRDALGLLEQAAGFAGDEPLTAGHVAAVLGAVDGETVRSLLHLLETGDAAALFTQIEQLYQRGCDMAQVCRDLLGGLREEVVSSLSTASSAHQGSSARTELAWRLQTVELLAQAEAQMRRSSQPRLLLEVALMRSLLGLTGPVTAAPEPAVAPIAPRTSGGEPTTPSHPAAVARSRPTVARPEGSTGDAQPACTAPPPAAMYRPEDRLWESFLEAVRRLHPLTHGLLVGARLLDASGGNLRIAFPNVTLAEQAIQRASVLEKAWAEVSGKPTHVVCTNGETVAAATPDASGGPPRRSSATHSPRPHDAAAGSDASRAALRPESAKVATAFQLALTRFAGTPIRPERSND